MMDRRSFLGGLGAALASTALTPIAAAPDVVTVMFPRETAIGGYLYSGELCEVLRGEIGEMMGTRFV